MDEFGIRGPVQKFHGFRQPQQRRRGEQGGVRHGDDGADRAGVVGMAVGILVGGGRWLWGRGLCKGGLHCGRRVSDAVEMAERQRKLDRQR